MTIQHAWTTAILGDHNCGQEFNGISQDMFFSRIYYPCLWGMAAIISIVSAFPALRGLKRTPAEVEQ